MSKGFSFEKMVALVGSVFDAQQDTRRQKQCKYQLSDAGLGAFAVFYTQSPSFLAYQRDFERRKGQSNCQTLFEMVNIPTDPHIRNLLDPIEASSLAVVFRHTVTELQKAGVLKRFEVMDGHYLLALDGTEYFSSEKIHCPKCRTQELTGGRIRYSHGVIPAVLVAPEQKEVISLEPEFMLPQDGDDKQDSELKAAKRWIKERAEHYPFEKVIVLGDDLYSHQPYCEAILTRDWHFVLVCKAESHQTLYDYLTLQTPKSFSTKRWTGRYRQVWDYRYATDLPLREGEDALSVNWCELSISCQDTGELLYRNSFITDLELDRDSVIEVIRFGRSRWKTENENNNVLKTQGYHFEHNYGHGQQNLSTVLLSLLLLAFLTHTILALTDRKYQAIRKELGSRKTFFDDIRALLRYKLFDSWVHLLDFMIDGLEIRLDTS